MILDNKTEGVILEEGEVQESTNMEIDAESHVFLMRMLSKFYSDGVSSLIRETASNALDSHRQVDSKEPIIVCFIANKDGNYEFSVEDFGAGMDDKDVENVISKYGKSTKRKSKNQLGAFGLGFKSPLAYSTSFYFIGRKNGIERKWMMYEAEDEQNKIDLLHQAPTTEKNGVKVIVPVKYQDKTQFTNGIRAQLSYFEGVYFNCPDIKNEFIIARHEHFQWSELCPDFKMHICLDNVYYPIDFGKLGIAPIDFPVGLRFGLEDGLFPIPNREQLKYTPEAKAIIMDKIKLVANYFTEKYNESIQETDDIKSIFDYFQSSARLVNSLGGNRSQWDINPLKKYSTVQMKVPTLKGVKLLDLGRIATMRDYLLQEYKANYVFTRKRFTAQKSKYNQQIGYNILQNYPCYIFTDSLLKRKQDWLRETLPTNHMCYIVRKEEFIPLKNKSKNYDSYYTMLQLASHPKGQWRAMIKEFQYIISLVAKKFVNLDEMVVPQTWIEARKKKKVAVTVDNKKRRKKLSGEVTCKMATHLERSVYGKNCKFESVTFKLQELQKDKMFTVYTGNSEECEKLIQKMYTLFRTDEVRFVMFSDREMKNLVELDVHNWMKMEEFQKGKHKIFRRMVTAYLVNELYEKNQYVFNKTIMLEKVSKDLKTKIDKLNEYKNKYYLRGDKAFYDAAVLVAQENRLFDNTTYPLYLEIKTVLDRLKFLNVILGSISPYYRVDDDGIIDVIRDLFKYYKQKMDWEHYQIKLEESEELTEEVLEQLED